MTRASYVTPGQTAARIENLRLLVSTLMVRQLRRDEIGNMLKMGPSGVRKYLADLGARITVARYADETPTCAGQPVYCLAITSEQAQAYLAQLAEAPVARPKKAPRSALSIAARDPSRRIHIMHDDAHYSVRLHSAPAARDPLVAALFGARAAEVRA